MKISVSIHDFSCDTLHLQNFNGKDFKNLLSQKFASKVVFQSQTSLKPGLYLLLADSSVVTEILISDSLHQKFFIEWMDQEIVFKNSPENSKNIEFQQTVNKFSQEMQSLEQHFYQIQSSGIRDEVKHKLMDSLQQHARLLFEKQNKKRQEMLQQFPDALVASLIKATSDLPEPPQYMYQNQMMLMQFEIEHFFDNYPFEDERLLNTPIAYDQFSRFAAMLYRASDFLPNSVVTQTLNKARISEKSFLFLYEILEKNLGNQSSPFWTEDVYIEMLKNRISNENDTLQRQFYQMQLKRFDKNRTGSLIPDFEVKLSDGSTTNIYSIQSEYLLLYFQNPDCPTCIETREELKVMAALNQAIDAKKIKVVTVYFEQDEQLWRRYLQQNANPKYINAWDYRQEIESKELFELSVIPFMFLLDQDKRVIKKDIMAAELEDFLQNKVNNN